MPRLLSRWTQLALDLAVLSAAFWLAFVLRFEGRLPEQMFKRLLFIWPYAIGIKFIFLMVFGVTRFSWRYFGLRETIRVFAATATTSALLLAVRIGAPFYFDIISGPAQYIAVPMGVVAIDFLLSFLGTVGVRVMRRVQSEANESKSRRDSTAVHVPTLLIGAGQAGLLVAKEIATRRDLGIQPVGFIDDDAHKHGTVVYGIPVLGPTSRLEELCRKSGAQQVLITIANARGTEIRRIKAVCDEIGLPAKIIPGIYEIVGGQVNLSRIRSVSIEDLLGREAVVLETEVISDALRDRVVLVSGAGGSIGSELCRQICRFGPRKLILVEQAENSLFQVHRELIGSFPALAAAIVPCIADICDSRRVEGVFQQYRPSVVFHAAAHKHVPMMEMNPGEAVKNNVFGTKTLADAAHLAGVGHFVMISTDKAVNPTSVMGVSKRVAEIYIHALSQQSSTRFVTVRFGNVLGSAGSVIPIFQEQIANGGPVTVTHAEMKRYFMTIPEACQLVLQAGAMGRGGEIFILDMGEPVKIMDLARDLITLSGFRPGEDIEIEVTGIRPGEKLFEELSVAAEVVDKTRHPKIFVGRVRVQVWDEVLAGLALLRTVADTGGVEQVRTQLRQIVPEYASTAEPVNAAVQSSTPPERVVGRPAVATR